MVSKLDSMTTNKERIKALKARLGGVQDGMLRLELGVTDKLHHLEETINKLFFQPEKPLAITTMGKKDLSAHIERSLTAAVKFFLQKWQSWNFQNTLVLIQLNGSILSHNFSNFRVRQRIKKSL